MRIFFDRKTLVLAVFALCSLFLASCSGPASNPNANKPNTNVPLANKSPTAPACPANADVEINAYMNEKTVNKATGNPLLTGITKQFNYNSYNCELDIRGFITDPKAVIALYQIAYKSPHNPVIKDTFLKGEKGDYPNLPDPVDGGCGDPNLWEKCGEICVPKGTCNTNAPGTVPASASPSPKSK